MMYQVRVDVVKEYYREIKHREIKDAIACHIDLEYEQYKQAKLKWLNDEVWLLLCAYWCSDVYKVKRKRGQASRSSSEDIAQNRGGSRPFRDTSIGKVWIAMVDVVQSLAAKPNNAWTTILLLLRG